jgi:uncharacterized protein (TIGR03000 family)
MYTLVLMSALSSAPDAAEFNGFFRRLFSFGGGGCCGGSCTGSGYGSCTGSRLRAYTSCCGGTGRGYGSCTGSSFAAGSCTGSGYSSSCTGSGMGVSPPIMGSDLAVPTPAVSYFYPTLYLPPADGGSGCVGSGLGAMPPMTLPAIPSPGLPTTPLAPPQPASPDASVPDSPAGRGTSYAGGGRATVVVRLPADAALFAEGRKLTLAGGERTFTTPPLPAGDWGYTFKAEYTRDGETISRSKRVAVRPGDSLVVEFAEAGLARTTQGDPKPAAAGLVKGGNPFAVPTVVPPAADSQPKAGPAAAPREEPARLTIKLPPGATLTVDGKRVDRGGDFRTPPLAPGREYRYQMQAELVSNGRPERRSTTVSFRAGELVTVDLTDRP